MTSLRFIKFFILFLFINIGFVSSSLASSKDEKAISLLLASDRELQNIDRSLNVVYSFLMESLKAAEKKSLIQEQKKWLVERNTHLNNINDLKKFYYTRYYKLYDIQKPYLEKILSTFLNSKQTINYNNLDEPLSKCSMFDTCKAYKAFIDYERSKKTPEDIEKAKKIFEKITEYDEGFFIKDPERTILSSLADLNLYSDLPDDFQKLPLWLVLKFPASLEFARQDRYVTPVNIGAQSKLDNLPEFKKFASIFEEMCPYYLVENSYCGGQLFGSISRDVAAGQADLIQKLSFAPSLVQIVGANPVYENLEVWSYYGIWNRLMFKKLLSQKEKAILDLKKYYEQNYNLKSFAAKAEELLSTYVDSMYFGHLANEDELSKSFKLVKSIKGTISELEAKTKDFTKDDFNEMLHIAILADYPLDSIEWLIKNGADVNNKYQDETPLMNAVTRPEILKLLLSKGADIEAKNTFGKTALFYAVQFGGKDSVEIILKNGANVNAKLITLDDLKAQGTLDTDGYKRLKVCDDQEYLPENVFGFTSLIYALRYGDDDVLNLLLSHGGNLGQAPKDSVSKWVLQSENMTKEIFDRRIGRVK